MYDDAQVAEVGRVVLLGREEEVDIAVRVFMSALSDHVERRCKGRMYFAAKLGPVMFPCLPDRSPTSHL